MTSKEVVVEKLAGGLCLYIMQLEPLRPPSPTGVTQYTIKILFKLLFRHGERDYLFKNKSDLYQETKDELSEFYKNTGNIGKKEERLESSIFLIWLFLVIGLSLAISILNNLTIFNALLVALIISCTTLYLFLVWISTRRRQIVGKKYDENLKRTVQLLVDYGIELVHENDLDPQNFPIKLRHNDYNGLKYEKKGKNNYLGFFEK